MGLQNRTNEAIGGKDNHEPQEDSQDNEKISFNHKD